jgi:hypothetical protein
MFENNVRKSELSIIFLRVFYKNTNLVKNQSITINLLEPEAVLFDFSDFNSTATG